MPQPTVYDPFRREFRPLNLPNLLKPSAERPTGVLFCPVHFDFSRKLSPAEQWLIRHESGGSVTAHNPGSSAFGLGQLLGSTRKKYAMRYGFNPNTRDYGEQLAMMRAYIRDTYRTPENAVAFWQTPHLVDGKWVHYY